MTITKKLINTTRWAIALHREQMDFCRKLGDIEKAADSANRIEELSGELAQWEHEEDLKKSP